MKKIGLIAVLSVFLMTSPAHAIPIGDAFMFAIKAMRYTTELQRVANYITEVKKQAEELAKQNEYLGPIIAEMDNMKSLASQFKEFQKEVNGTKKFFEDLAENGFVPEEFRDLIAFPTDAAKSFLAKNNESNSKMTVEGVMFKAIPESNKGEALKYVKDTFFAKTKKELTAAKAQELQQKRQQMQKEVNSENYMYSQVVKTDGQEDFVKRMDQLAKENKAKESNADEASEEKAKEEGVSSEAKAWAVNTLALRNVIQETMVRVVLEQRLLEQETVNILASQPLVLISDPAEK